jgi:hypothetical protein
MQKVRSRFFLKLELLIKLFEFYGEPSSKAKYDT